MGKNDQEERPWRNEWILIRQINVERISPPTLLHHEPRLCSFSTKIKPFHESFIVQVLCDCCYDASLIQNLSWQSAKMTFFVCQKQVCILIILITTAASAASRLKTMLLYAIYIMFHFVCSYHRGSCVSKCTAVADLGWIQRCARTPLCAQ